MKKKGGCNFNETKMQLWENIKRQQKDDAKNKETNKQINTEFTCVLNKWLLAY
jgi:hypothetical protein